MTSLSWFQASGEEGEEEGQRGVRVLCVPPDDELGFLLNLPPPCNVVLQPSTIGLSGKANPDSAFLLAFKKFLKGGSSSLSSLSTLFHVFRDFSYSQYHNQHRFSSEFPPFHIQALIPVATHALSESDCLLLIRHRQNLIIFYFRLQP